MLQPGAAGLARRLHPPSVSSGAATVSVGELQIAATTSGYGQLVRWVRELGPAARFGVEGTGSYGAGLHRYLRRHGLAVVEVNRPDRSTRHRRGKSDPIDAEAAARAVLAGTATGIPKAGDDQVE